MTRVVRLAGAIVVATDAGRGSIHFLVGDTKVPCDWEAAGFARPKDRDPRSEPYVRLQVAGPVQLPPASLHLTAEGEAAARLMAERMLIARTGSVSERLWRLVTGQCDDDSEPGCADDDLPATACIEARWLEEVPASVWNVVRGAVLRCT
jgi:hypothetical protein